MATLVPWDVSRSPLTRLRTECPACGNCSLHLYPFLDKESRCEVFLWCECGYDGFATGDDPIVRSAVPFRPQMFSNGYFRGLARHPRACPECGTSPTMLLDTPNPNTANEVCDVCGYFGCLMAPMEVKRRGRKKDEWIKSEVSEKKKGVVIQFRPKHDEGNELAD